MIDWARVTELRDEVGAEDFDEVVALFLEEVDEVIARLRHAPDQANLEADLHFLKGSAMSLGFAAFSALCAEGEWRAAAGSDTTDTLSDVLACYAGSRARFLSELPARLGDP